MCFFTLCFAAWQTVEVRIQHCVYITHVFLKAHLWMQRPLCPAQIRVQRGRCRRQASGPHRLLHTERDEAGFCQQARARRLHQRLQEGSQDTKTAAMFFTARKHPGRARGEYISYSTTSHKGGVNSPFLWWQSQFPGLLKHSFFYYRYNHNKTTECYKEYMGMDFCWFSDVCRSPARERQAQVQVAGQQKGTGQDPYPVGESHSGRTKEVIPNGTFCITITASF